MNSFKVDTDYFIINVSALHQAQLSEFHERCAGKHQYLHITTVKSSLLTISVINELWTEE